MGLLDTLSSDDVLSGLLSAGAASGAKGNFLSRMAQGAMAGEKFAQGRREEARQRSQDEMQAEYKKLMMLKMQRDEQQAAAAAEQAQRKREALPGLFGGRQVPGQISTPTMGGIEMFSQGSTQEPPRTVGAGQLDFMKALQAGYGADEIQKLAALPNLGKPKVTRIETVNVNGKPMKVGVDEYGQQVAQIGLEWRPLKTQDMGGYVGAFDETNPGAGITKLGDKSQTPESIASNETSRRGQDITARGQNMADARARDLNAISGGAKAPTGYRFKADGSLEAIPGGPADIKAGELGAKADARRQSQAAQATSVLETIGDAKSLVGNTTAGFGAFAANLPATDARNLSAKLETIKANLGFDRLQQMREQSPTGGALGAVAVQELTALQSTVASLDQKQSPAQLKASLDRIEKHYKRWQDVVQQSGAQSSGGASGGWGGVVDFGSLK